MPNRKFNTYSQHFKLKAVKEYLKGEKGYKSLCKELGIKDTKTLREWVKKYHASELLTGVPDKKQFLSHEEEILYLRAEIAYLQEIHLQSYGEEYEIRQ